jgi:hypothetical protein
MRFIPGEPSAEFKLWERKAQNFAKGRKLVVPSASAVLSCGDEECCSAKN